MSKAYFSPTSLNTQQMKPGNIFSMASSDMNLTENQDDIGEEKLSDDPLDALANAMKKKVEKLQE